MTSPERETPALATHEDASLVLSDVDYLTTMQGDGKSFEFPIGIAATEVAANFPPDDPTSEGAVDSLEIARLFDRESGRPAETGPIARVTYVHSERRDKDLTYQTQVDYMIVADEGGNRTMKRHTMQREVGPHRSAADFMMQAVALQQPGVMEAHQRQHEATLAAEDAMGLPDVTSAEAQAIARDLDSLKPIPEQR